MGCSHTGKFTTICRVLGCYDGLFSVSLYDSCKKMIDLKYADRDGRAVFIIPQSGVYSVYACAYGLSPKAISSKLYLNRDDYCLKYFIFNEYHPERRIIHATFHLTDQNYTGLPILKGVTKLWQLPIT